jgi:hypothetical protein
MSVAHILNFKVQNYVGFIYDSFVLLGYTLYFRLRSFQRDIHGPHPKSFSNFFASKSAMVKPTFQLIQNFKNFGKDINVIRFENGRKNKALENGLTALNGS